MVDPLERLDPPIVVEPPEPARASVVWLHGLGADGHDFEPVVEQLGEAARRAVRYVFPHAPMRPVTVNGGVLMRAWYDIADLDLDRRADEAGVRESARILDALVEREHAGGIPFERIVAAGFSQGGAIALHAGLRRRSRLAGIMALSTYVALEGELDSGLTAAGRETPVFLAHGSQDPVVPLALNERSRRALRARGCLVETHTYPMQHAVCPEELRDIDDWLERVLA